MTDGVVTVFPSELIDDPLPQCFPGRLADGAPRDHRGTRRRAVVHGLRRSDKDRQVDVGWAVQPPQREGARSLEWNRHDRTKPSGSPASSATPSDA